MKKLVPDPPPVLCIREGLSLDEAVEDAPLQQETLIGDSVLQIMIGLALLKVCANHRAVVV